MRFHGICRLPAALALGATLIAPGALAAATDTPPPVSRLVTSNLIEQTRGWLNAPVTHIVLAAQNERSADFTQADIDALDTQWREQREAEHQPLVARILGNPLSVYLTQIQARSLGLYTEVFVMDMKGLNAGQSAITSDYWQGDEAKFQKTALVGPDAVFIDEPEFHEGSGTWRVQVNLPLTDDDGTTVVGAATVEMNLTELQRRNRAQF